MQNHTLLRSLPKVDKFIEHRDFQNLSKTVLLPILRDALEVLRNDILAEKISEVNSDALRQNILEQYNKIMTPSLQKVINATGVIVHTNLGRSLINPESFDKAKEIATSYNNLEYDLERGRRGERYSHLSALFTKLLDCEDVLVVNNNASAVFLILNTFAKRKEVIVSRGELVEIGGSFVDIVIEVFVVDIEIGIVTMQSDAQIPYPWTIKSRPRPFSESHKRWANSPSPIMAMHALFGGSSLHHLMLYNLQ
jgi:hypothetical protein